MKEYNTSYDFARKINKLIQSNRIDHQFINDNMVADIITQHNRFGTTDKIDFHNDTISIEYVYSMRDELISIIREEIRSALIETERYKDVPIDKLVDLYRRYPKEIKQLIAAFEKIEEIHGKKDSDTVHDSLDSDLLEDMFSDVGN